MSSEGKPDTVDDCGSQSQRLSSVLNKRVPEICGFGNMWDVGK